MKDFRFKLKNSTSTFTLDSFPNIEFLTKHDFMTMMKPSVYVSLLLLVCCVWIYFLYKRLIIWKLEADFVEEPNERKALRYSNNDKLGLIRSIDCSTIFPAICDDIIIADKDLFILKKDYRYGLCNVIIIEQ